MSQKKRIEWIDIAKGLGMLLVILGHAVPIGGVLHNLIFAFHMPLFFVLSGLVYKPLPFVTLFWKRFKSLLVPYILFFALGTGIAGLRSELTIKKFLRDVYFGNPTNTYVSSVWFLAALFISTMLFDLILKLKKRLQYLAIALLLVGGIAYGECYTHGLIHTRLPLDLDVVPVAVFFLAIGYYGKEYVLKGLDDFKEKKTDIQWIILVAAGVVFSLIVLWNGTVNLHGITYRNPVLYIAESILGSGILMLFSVWVGDIFVKKPLIWIGANNIYFLGAQAIGIRFCIFAINSFFDKEFLLYGLPYVYGILAFLITTIFSIAFTWGIQALWCVIKEISRRTNYAS